MIPQILYVSVLSLLTALLLLHIKYPIPHSSFFFKTTDNFISHEALCVAYNFIQVISWFGDV